MIRIEKWGSSLGIRIPEYIVDRVEYREGTVVEIEVAGNKIIITRQKQILKELVSQITSENKHEEIEFGGLKGKEKW